MDKFQAVAWLPGTRNFAVIAQDGTVGYVQAYGVPRFVPQFPQFVDAAVLKYGYTRIQPAEVTLQSIGALADILAGG
jgi:hypothetical protein